MTRKKIAITPKMVSILSNSDKFITIIGSLHELMGLVGRRYFYIQKKPIDIWDYREPFIHIRLSEELGFKIMQRTLIIYGPKINGEFEVIDKIVLDEKAKV